MRFCRHPHGPPFGGCARRTDVLELERYFDTQLGAAARALFDAWVSASDDLARPYIFGQIRLPTLRSVQIRAYWRIRARGGARIRARRG